MNLINLKSLSKIIEKNAVARKAFTSGVTIVLRILEQQRLIDFRQIEQVSLDWNKGTLNLGDGFMESVVGRAFGQYVIDNARLKRQTRVRANVQQLFNEKMIKEGRRRDHNVNEYN